MKAKAPLMYALQVVGCLFGAFGGFLVKVAPPDQTHVKAIVGTTQFLVLIVLLIVKATTQLKPQAKMERRWLTSGILFFLCAIVVAIVYVPYSSRHLFESQACPGGPRIVGRLSAPAERYMATHPRDFPSGQSTDLSWPTWQEKFGCDELFTPVSVQSTALRLSSLYAMLILSLTTSIFCLLEANIPAT